jgi:hypothetical protein
MLKRGFRWKGDCVLWFRDFECIGLARFGRRIRGILRGLNRFVCQLLVPFFDVGFVIFLVCSVKDCGQFILEVGWWLRDSCFVKGIELWLVWVMNPSNEIKVFADVMMEPAFSTTLISSADEIV